MDHSSQVSKRRPTLIGLEPGSSYLRPTDHLISSADIKLSLYRAASGWTVSRCFYMLESLPMRNRLVILKLHSTSTPSGDGKGGRGRGPPLAAPCRWAAFEGRKFGILALALQCLSVSLYLHCALSCAVYSNLSNLLCLLVCLFACLLVCLFVGPPYYSHVARWPSG